MYLCPFGDCSILSQNQLLSGCKKGALNPLEKKCFELQITVQCGVKMLKILFIILTQQNIRRKILSQ